MHPRLCFSSRNGLWRPGTMHIYMHVPWGVWLLFWKCCIVTDCPTQHVLIFVVDKEVACDCSYKNSWIKVSKSVTSKPLTLMQSCSFPCSFLHFTLVHKWLKASSTWHFCGRFSDLFLMLLLHNGLCISTLAFDVFSRYISIINISQSTHWLYFVGPRHGVLEGPRHCVLPKTDRLRF